MAATDTPTAFIPPPPRTTDALGIPAPLITDLFVRRAYLDGVSTIFGLCESLKLPHRAVEQVFLALRQQQLIEVKGILGEDYSFSLTNAGHRLAINRRQISQYAGPAPVPLRQYEAAVRAQTARVRVNRASLAQAFADLVVTDSLLDQVGPALVSQKSLFLYGPTGNGKTSIAERLMRVYEDEVWLPYAVEVDSQIVVVYDPVIHQRIDDAGQDCECDPRWVRCKRPFIVVGGELTPSMLELRLDLATQIYAAPLQMKANNGILVIDDFGRQVMSPRKLLNRWILPLDRRVDYLTLRYGVKFAIPFELMVVFSTNLEPTDLADEAFLRRIHNKVFVEPVSVEVFDEIFARVVRNVPTAAGAAAHLRQRCASAGAQNLKACLPGDICRIVEWMKEYEGRPFEISLDDLDRAVALYFARDSGRTA